MIVDKLSNAHKYFSYGPRVQKAFEYLQAHAEDLITMEAGRVDIEDGNDNYALVLDRPCDPDYDAYWEGHSKYLDIHYVADGEEWFGYCDISRMREIERHEQVPGEYAKYVDQEGQGVHILLRKGEFCLTDVDDIHRPSVYRAGSPFLRKVCVKVRL